MLRRFLLTFVLVVAGFTAGMVLTGRMRYAADSVAEPALSQPAPAAEAQQQRTAPTPQVSGTLATGPDFTKIAGQGVKGVANISSLQVEGIAASHPAVKAAAVYGVPSDTLDSEHEIKLDVILKAGEALRPEELARFINERAPYFCVPRYIEFVGELPYTPTQKLEKYKLREKGLSADTWDRLGSGFELQR